MSYYVRSLTPEDPVVREVIEAKRVEKLPASLDDSLWNDVAPFWIPLVGQIIVKPRWFSPAVTGVWVQALHDGRDLAMRVSWDDRSNSPDAGWAEWRARVMQVMEPKEADSAATAANAGDALAIWFPRNVPAGMERPYFYMGSGREPVYVWRWQSRGPVEEMMGRGPGKLEKLPTTNGLVAQSVFDKGQWRVLFRRPLVAKDSASAITYTVGQPIPVAFFAWDADNGEQGTQGSLSTWYFVYLGEPTGKTVYATPLIATLLTAAVGVFAVRRAQRREAKQDNTSANS
jgi:DMSO reductase family type II enzyme heme b subunit